MQDNDIKKALECCVNKRCIDCPLMTWGCTYQVAMAHSLDYINRLEAENERLKVRLRKERHHFADIGKMHSEIKAEAYKEFAERLNKIEKFRSCVESYNYELSVTMREVDNLLKEMIGE